MLGWAQEHGAYAMEDGTTNFVRNDYSWNLEANMFYIESPAGVGYSVCGEPTECVFDDDNSATDNLYAVLYLFNTSFTELAGNDMWISGESYAGVYVPKLVQQIDNYLATAKETDYKPNLKGFIVGNGVTNWKYDGTPSYFHMSYYHGLIDDVLFNNVNKNCNLTYYDID
jgi:carboxypeptidase C (cathepsin A)